MLLLSLKPRRSPPRRCRVWQAIAGGENLRSVRYCKRADRLRSASGAHGPLLIVDDEPLIAMLAQDWLEDLGHQTLGPAHDLKTALTLAQEPMDAAILDVSLGADKSFEVARRLREPTRSRSRSRPGMRRNASARSSKTR